jgi:hypothetical protein
MNHLSLTTEISGEYKLVINRADGTTEETGWFSNIILDTGMDRMASTAGYIWVLQYARVGTGNSTPVATQVSLDAQIAFSSQNNGNTVVVNEGSPLYRTTLTHSFAFAQGAVIGNISEIGVGWATTGTSLFSRALILDNLGSPTTITLVALDQLTVYYRIRLVPPITDTTGSVTISSTTYPYTARVASVGSFAASAYIFTGPYAGALGSLTTPNADYCSTHSAGTSLAPITSTPANSSGSVPTVVYGTYTNGTFYRDDVFTWGVAAGNATGGIQCIVLAYVAMSTGSFIKYQYRFDTVIPKTGTNTLTLRVRISWARA